MTGSESTLFQKAIGVLLEQILADAHPLLAEGLMVAAIPHSYDVPLFGLLRARDDGRDQRLAERIAEFSFVERLPDDRYRIAQSERAWLHARWQTTDADGYRAAHRRTLDYLSAHPLSDPFTQDQALLYHELLCDPTAGMVRYYESARRYVTNHQLAALERLIITAREATSHLAAIEPPPLALSARSDYLSARLLQLRGDWADSLPLLQGLLSDPTFPHEILPFAQRAQGLALAHQGRYMDAVDAYKEALKGFSDAGDCGETMIHIGDAYRDLAVAARGHDLFPPPPVTGVARLRVLLGVLPALPILLYFLLQGFDLRSRSLWESQSGQDWLLARLFGMAARWYQRANKLLDPLPQLIGAGLLPDERLADLMLTVGDAQGAVRCYQALIEQPPSVLSDYRRAMAGLGLAKGLLRQGEDGAAQAELLRVRPLLDSYQDEEAIAQSELLLGEIALRAPAAATEKSIAHFQHALDYYRDQSDRIAQTEIAERLETAADEPSNAPERDALLGLAAQVTERSYRVRFRHSLVLLFQRLSLAFIALALFLIPMVTLDPQPPSLLDLTLDVGWDPQAAAEPLNLAVSPDLVPTGPPTLRLSAALGTTIQLIVGYLAAQLALGLLLILFTQTREIERELQREQVHLGREEIGTGESAGMRWDSVTEGIGADMRLGRSLLPDNSGLLLRGDSDQQVWLPGQTARYETLRHRLQGRWPQREVGYSLLYSTMGAIYLSGLVLLSVTIALNHFRPELTNQPLLGPYSLVQLYPFGFLLLMGPTLWWAAVRPLRMYRELDRLSPLLWWVASSGIALALLRLVMPGRPWFSYPDIFPSLIALFLLGIATVILWQTRRDPPGPLPTAHTFIEQPHPLRLPRTMRSALMVVMVLLMVPMALRLGRDVLAYHAWVKGQRALSVALTTSFDDNTFSSAEQGYQAALRLDPHHRLALQGLAAVQTFQSRYTDALQTFNRALEVAPTDQSRAYLLSDRAAMYARWSLEPEAGRQGNDKWALAEQDLMAAYALVPSQEIDQKRAQLALIRGWLAYENEQYSDALPLFDQASRSGASSGAVALGRGYALYKLNRFDEARAAWSEAISAQPDNALLYAARALATWQVARREEPGLCEDGIATPETVRRIEEGLADIERSIAHEPLSFSYRTLAQFHFLLRSCPGHDLVKEFEAAIAGYQQATTLTPTEPYYWEMLARLRFALTIQADLPAEEEIQLRSQAADALAEAMRLAALPAPEGEPRIGLTPDFPPWPERIFIPRGDDLYRAGDYAGALAAYQRVSEVTPTASTWFKVARALVMLGRSDEAAVAYHDGIHISGNDVTLIPATVARLGETLSSSADIEARLTALAAALEADFDARIRPTGLDTEFLRGRALLATSLADLPGAGSAQAALCVVAAHSEDDVATIAGIAADEARAATLRAALLYFRAGRDADAEQRYRSALAGVPADDPARRDALAALDALVAAYPALAARAEALRPIITGTP